MSFRRAVHIVGLFIAIIWFVDGELCPLGAAQAQPPPPPAAGTTPVIKAETRLVLVDAIVTDKKGNYLSDLSQKDFRVWEDDAEQPIKTFSLETSAADSQSPPRYLVLFFDDSNITGADRAGAREAAAKFIQANAGPNRYIAVLDFGSTLNVAQNFTTDAERLKQAVLNDKFSTVSSNRDPVRVANQAGQESTFNAAGDYGARTLLLGIRGVARKLAAMPGRKSLVLLSPGFIMTPRQQSELMAAMDACNKANVAIYPVALRGLTNDVTAEAYVANRYDNSTMGPQHGSGGVAPSSRPGNAASQGLVPVPTGPATGGTSLPSSSSNAASNALVLDSLATSTGGFVIVSSSDVLAKMEKIAQEQSQYYVLGYTPSSSQEGSCHKLRVKVDRSGAEVRSRSVYCKVKTADPLAEKPVEKVLEARASGETPGNISASMRAPYFYTSPNVARVDLAIEIPPGAIELTEKKGKFEGSIDILGLAYNPDGTVGVRFSDSVPLEFESKKDLKNFQQKPLHYDHQFEAAPGKYDLKVAFTSGGESFGKLEIPLLIDPYDGKQIAISTVAFSKDVYPISQAGEALNAALLEDKVPLVSRGFEFVPSGTGHFKKSQAGAFYVEIYDPLLLSSNPPQVGLEVKVIERNTGAVKMDARGAPPEVKSGSSMVPVGLKIPLATLAPGTYRLELRATDSAGGATALRSTEFEVE